VSELLVSDDITPYKIYYLQQPLVSNCIDAFMLVRGNINKALGKIIMATIGTYIF